MKILRKWFGVFFIIATLISASFFLTGCNDDSAQTQNFSVVAENRNSNCEIEDDSTSNNGASGETDIADEQNTDQEEPEEEAPTTEPEEVEIPIIKEEKIYITSLSTEEEIYLSNNGVGINFIVNFLPSNTTENIYINIENESVVNFASEIDSATQTRPIDFTTMGNMLYPLSVGQTTITISAKKNETEDILATCVVVVEEYEQKLELEILDSDGNKKTSDFMSGLKANGEYESYTAKVASINDLKNKLNIIYSNDIIISEKSYFYIDGICYCSFNFCIDNSGSQTLQVSVKDTYSNLSQVRYSDEIQIVPTNFVQSIFVDVSREDEEESVTTEGEYYVLYYTDKTKTDLADEYGSYNNYTLNVYDSNNNIFNNFSVEVFNTAIVDIEMDSGVTKVLAKSVGQIAITVKALDGSGQCATINFKVVEIEPTLLKIGDVDLLSDYSQEDLASEIGEIIIYEPNDLGKTSSAELSINIANVFVKDAYAYFEIVDSGITASTSSSQDDESLIKTFTFNAQTSGEYTINLRINGEIIYTFEIKVLDSENYLKFSTENTNTNIVYNFENKTITLSSFNSSSNNKLSFSCKTVNINNEPQEQNIELGCDDLSFCTLPITLGDIFLKIEKSGDFTLTISEKNYGLSVEFKISIKK